MVNVEVLAWDGGRRGIKFAQEESWSKSKSLVRGRDAGLQLSLADTQLTFFQRRQKMAGYVVHQGDVAGCQHQHQDDNSQSCDSSHQVIPTYLNVIIHAASAFWPDCRPHETPMNGYNAMFRIRGSRAE